MCARYNEAEISVEQFRLIADQSHDMIKIVDIHGKIEYASPSHYHILGYVNENGDIYQYVHPDDQGQLESFYRGILQNKDSGMIEYRKRGKRGEWIWVESAVTPVLTPEGVIQNILFVMRDITERKQYQAELERMAFHDHLTGLYNRRKMRMLLEETMNGASDGEGKFAYMIMDLDKFKSINDTYGHDAGDLVLKKFADVLLQCKGETDAIGRLSGDEFAVILRGIEGEGDAENFKQRVRAALAEPYAIPGSEFSVSVKTSMGYSIYPDSSNTPSELFKKADNALYKEKRKRHQLRFRREGDRRAFKSP